jgi:NADPH:quinone reductase-like Zn-dependent oxidoreductase
MRYRHPCAFGRLPHAILASLLIGGTAGAAGDARMRAIVYREYGTTEVLHLEQIDKPVPKDDQVLVHVRASSVNPLEWHYMRGTPYITRLSAGLLRPEEIRIGVDFAGVVEAVGKDVTRFKPGDEVFGGRTGALADYVVVRESRAIALKPANISFEQAAGVPIAAITALQGIRDVGKLQPGDKVLVNGASGGVGTFAVQIAKALGGEVTGVCSGRSADLVRSLGASRIIDYTREDFAAGEQRYDVILDCVGNRALADYRRVLTPKGRLVLIGGGGTDEGNWVGPIARLLRAALLSPFVSQKIGTLFAELNGKDLSTLADLMQSGKVTPVIDRRYGLADVPRAIDYLEQGHAHGKVIISLDDAPGPSPAPATHAAAVSGPMDVLAPILVLVLGLGGPIAGSLALNRRFRRLHPDKRSYRWGYYFGLQFFVIAVGIPLLIDAGVGPVLACAGVSALLAWAFARRRRWAWLALTVLSLNPVAWLINFLYLRRRWAEDGQPA